HASQSNSTEQNRLIATVERLPDVELEAQPVMFMLDCRDQSVLLGAIGLAGMLAAVGETNGLGAEVEHPRGQQ
ncbi:hypothetical protein, partial [Aeromonas caviae]|uniref:hypothetical protein n=1 Tax=Aeromonas caviae TaxID=648 RepID=UPI001CC4C115